MQTIARANRVAEGKTNGLVIDYTGIVKALRQALADYTSQKGNSEGQDPTIDKEMLVIRVRKLIAEAKDFLLKHNFNLDDLVSSSEFERIALLKTAANELCVDLKTKKEFQTIASELFRLWKYLNKDEKDLQMAKERNAISGIYNELIEKRKNADTVDLMVQINRIVNEYVSTESPKDETARSFDISNIDFDLLRKEFSKTKKKFLLIKDLEQLIEQRIASMLPNSPGRIKYHEKYQKIINEYNQEHDRPKIEKTFDDLMRLCGELDGEQQRYIREGFSTDEELSVYDLLFKDDLSKNDIKEIKKIAVELLAQIKEKIAELDHWRDKSDTQAIVSTLIRDSLFVSLPQSYDDQSINRYTDLIYEHVYNRYPAIAI